MKSCVLYIYMREKVVMKKLQAAMMVVHVYHQTPTAPTVNVTV